MPSIFANLSSGSIPEGYPRIFLHQPSLCHALEQPFYYSESYIILLLFSLPILFFISAPYGKLKQSTWTIDIESRLAWFMMESPAFIINLVLTFLLLPQVIENVQGAYLAYGLPSLDSINDGTTISTTILPPQINLYVITTFISFLFYNCHYIYRSIIYPQLTRSVQKHDFFPVILASIFNIANGTVQATGMFCHNLDITGLSFPMYVVGQVGFMLAWWGCYWSDMYLVSLRSGSQQKVPQQQSGDQPNGHHHPSSQFNPSADRTKSSPRDKSHYTIPTRGLFRWFYCANYVCEFLQWIFFALMVPSSPERWLFVALTFCNLFPRAYQYRKFYIQLAKERELTRPKLNLQGINQHYWSAPNKPQRTPSRASHLRSQPISSHSIDPSGEKRAGHDDMKSSEQILPRPRPRTPLSLSLTRRPGQISPYPVTDYYQKE